MDLPALANCLTATSCLITQTTSGLIIGLLLFLVAAGLTLIFGVLNVVNFTHGSFYMLGAYFAYTVYGVTGSYFLAVLGGALGVALFSLIFERFFMSRVYGSKVLMQHLVCYGFILIHDDAVKIIWGPEFKSMGLPRTFQAPPFLIGGGVIPVFYLFLIGVTLAIGLALWLIISRTRFGKVVRAAAVNPRMVSVLIESFIVTVIGGMGSILGALVGSILVGLVRAFGTIGFPLFTEGLMFLLMAIILIVKPSGLFGRET